MFLSQHRFFIRGTGDLLKHLRFKWIPFFFRFSLLQYKQQANFFKKPKPIQFSFHSWFCVLVRFL